MLKENKNLLDLPDIDLTTLDEMTTTYTRGTTYFELSNHASTTLSMRLVKVILICAKQAQPYRSKLKQINAVA